MAKSTQPELPAPNEAAPKTKRVADPELQAISEITKHMAALDPAAQNRVMSYLLARYSLSYPKDLGPKTAD